MRILVIISILYCCGCNSKTSKVRMVGYPGQMPAITTDQSKNVHLVYGSGDSIMYCVSMDNGRTFSNPGLLALLPHLAASHSRGPQIAATNTGLTVIACNNDGDIFAFNKSQESWGKSIRINDVDTVAKEGLMALSSDGDQVYAVWLDLRGNHKNKIYGSSSADGGRTWSGNIMVYTSPDTTVCECCKPSVLVNKNSVYVMFRNWLNGSRDLYLTESSDNGKTFGQAEKLGNGTWPLKGCPMDGGGMVLNESGSLQTVWRREGKIYADMPGKAEEEIGEGRSCTLETVNGKNVYAWTQDGDVIILKPRGLKMNLGKGHLPVLKALNNEHVICVWEYEKRIQSAIIEL